MKNYLSAFLPLLFLIAPVAVHAAIIPIGTDGAGRNWTYDDSGLGTGTLHVFHDGAATPFTVYTEGTFMSGCTDVSGGVEYTCGPGIDSGDPETDIDLGYGGIVLFPAFLTAQTCDGSATWGSCPTPPPTDGLGPEIDAASQGFASTTGFDIPSVINWAGDNLIKLFIGSGLAVLFQLRYWLVALVVIAAIIYFSYRAFRFFKH